MKRKKLINIILLCLLALMQACQKDKPTPIVVEKYCYDINNWDGLLSDSLLITEEEPLIPKVDTVFVEWLKNKNNRVDIRSLTSENFDDLKCMKQYFTDKTLVQLGESSHGTKEYNLIKVRLIKFLHEEMGFDIIAFEGGFFDCFYTYENINDYTAEQTLNNSIFSSVWGTEEVLELFEYIKQTQSTEHPLILSGFDCQRTGDNYYKRPDFLYDMLVKVDSVYADQVSSFDKHVLTYYMDHYNYLAEYADSIKTRYTEIISYIDQNYNQIIKYYPDKENYLVFAKKSILSTLAELRYMLTLHENLNKCMYVRDSAMASNISFLKEELYPGKKIIIWAHNAHIAYYPEQTSIHSTERNMGNWLLEKYREELYSIGLYMLRGKTNTEYNWTIIDVKLPTKSYSLEAILYHLRKKYIFVDVLNHPYENGNEWLYYNITTKYSGFMDEEMIIKDNYDGIVFIDTSSVPDYLN